MCITMRNSWNFTAKWYILTVQWPFIKSMNFRLTSTICESLRRIIIWKMVNCISPFYVIMLSTFWSLNTYQQNRILNNLHDVNVNTHIIVQKSETVFRANSEKKQEDNDCSLCLLLCPVKHIPVFVDNYPILSGFIYPWKCFLKMSIQIFWAIVYNAQLNDIQNVSFFSRWEQCSHLNKNEYLPET